MVAIVGDAQRDHAGKNMTQETDQVSVLKPACEAVTEFAEQNAIPVAHTMSAKDAIACVPPLSAGLFGRYDRIANDLIAASDCIIVAGCKLGEIATKRFTIPQAGQTVTLHGCCQPSTIARFKSRRAIASPDVIKR